MSRRTSRSRTRSNIHAGANTAVLEVAEGKNPSPVKSAGGCRICGLDDDHENLLICEKCGCEQHTYCVGLSKVPDDDYFCRSCSSGILEDPLEKLVESLPLTYKSRFGEICWAHGGTGFGWWPACIYDPRLTVGGARELAVKHAGKRHLVFFFECHNAPFAVSRNDRLCKWNEGITNGYDSGKVARAVGMQRSEDFDNAYQAALVELSRPIDQRMDFNHGDNSKVSNAGVGKNENSAKKKRNNSDDDSAEMQRPGKKRVRKKKRKDNENSALVSDSDKAAFENKNKKADEIKSKFLRNFYGKVSSALREVDRKALEATAPSKGIIPDIDSDGLCYCKIFLKEDESFINIGFIILKSRWKSLFVEARQFMTDKLDLKSGWKFYVPKLGPLSMKQEKELRVMPFLSSTAQIVKDENGTCHRPIRLFIIQNPDYLQNCSLTMDKDESSS